DQFIIQQIAADLLPLGEDKRPLAALGFLTVGRRFLNNVHDITDDRIDVVCRGTMALTVGCARCHDHKFDPIPTKDYYSLYGVFANTIEPTNVSLEPTLFAKIPQTPELLDYLAKSAELRKKEEELKMQFLEFRRTRDRDPQKRRELARAEGLLEREIGDLEIDHPGAPARA